MNQSDVKHVRSAELRLYDRAVNRCPSWTAPSLMVGKWHKRRMAYLTL